MMNNPNTRRAAGAVLIGLPVVFMACFTLLQIQFGYPDILRQPTGEVLRKFHAGGPQLVALWYIFALTALLFVPVTVIVHRAVAPERAPGYLWVGSAFGLLAALVQTLGLIRWPFLVPHLAEIYTLPASSQAQREAAALVFEAFHRYAGVALGEHLGYLCTGAWTFLVALAMLRSRLFRPWMALAGMALAAGIAAGMLEPLGWAAAGAVNALSYMGWSVWLAAVGVALIVRPRTPTTKTRRHEAGNISLVP